MKSIYKKINISSSFLLLIFLSLISGLFKDIMTLFLVIIIHEVGHILTSLYYGWNIKKINIGLCGGYIYYEELIDKPFKEEFFISISGFIMQLVLMVISIILYKNSIIDLSFFSLIQKYNISIFVFNLLPIIPLDGSKIINLLFNVFFPYRRSLKLTNILSVFVLMILLIYFFIFSFKIEYSYIMVFCFLIKCIILNKKEIPYLFNKFLFERYKYPIKSTKYKYIKGNKLNKLKRWKKHLFLIENKVYSEKKVLSKKFDYLSIL